MLMPMTSSLCEALAGCASAAFRVLGFQGLEYLGFPHGGSAHRVDADDEQPARGNGGLCLGRFVGFGISGFLRGGSAHRVDADDKQPARGVGGLRLGRFQNLGFSGVRVFRVSARGQRAPC